MRYLIITLALNIMFALPALATHVRGYTKKSGTYVAPHERSVPNHTQTDNWSTKGNQNPYTGKKGTRRATH